MKSKFLTIFLICIPIFLISMDEFDTKGDDGEGAAAATEEPPRAYSSFYQKWTTHAPRILGGTNHDEFLIDRFTDGTLFPKLETEPLEVSNMYQRAIAEATKRDLMLCENQTRLAAVIRIGKELQKKHPKFGLGKLTAAEYKEHIITMHAKFLRHEAKPTIAERKKRTSLLLAAEAKRIEQEKARIAAQTKAETEKLAQKKAAILAQIAAQEEVLKSTQAEREATLTAEYEKQTAHEKQQEQELLETMRKRGKLLAACVTYFDDAAGHSDEDEDAEEGTSQFDLSHYESQKAFQALLEIEDSEE